MLQTDLNGFVKELSNNKICQLLIIITILVIFIKLAMWFYEDSQQKNNNDNRQNNFANILIGTIKGGDRCSNSIPKMDEALILDTIKLPTRDPSKLTSSMVWPTIKAKEENKKLTRMEILNMFYNTFDDDITDISSRPKGLYVIP